MDKVILVIMDGLGDRPIPKFGNKTPLEAAKTPNLDNLARDGICGIMNTLGVGLRPGSDTSHLTILGYDPEEYYHGRGPFECAGIGMDLRVGDVALRSNIGTVGSNLVVKDRRAGRVTDTTPFVKEIDGTVVDGVKFYLKPGTGHRMGVIMRGKGLSSKISDSDPHELGVKILKAKPLDNSKEARFTADVLNKFLERSHRILKELPLNKKRIKEGLFPGNYLLVRGAGYIAKIPTFEEKHGLKACCIAGAGLYKGVGRILGMDVLSVKGATGLPDTNVDAKLRGAVKALKSYDFVFVHIKAADTFGEDGNFRGKKEFIEKADKAFRHLLGLKDTLIVVTADHSTPCNLKAHSGDPVPILFCGDGVRTDSTKKFGERECANGGLGRIRGLDVMPEVINLLGRAELIGA